MVKMYKNSLTMGYPRESVEQLILVAPLLPMEAEPPRSRPMHHGIYRHYDNAHCGSYRQL